MMLLSCGRNARGKKRGSSTGVAPLLGGGAGGAPEEEEEEIRKSKKRKIPGLGLAHCEQEEEGNI